MNTANPARRLVLNESPLTGVQVSDGDDMKGNNSYLREDGGISMRRVRDGGFLFGGRGAD